MVSQWLKPWLAAFPALLQPAQASHVQRVPRDLLAAAFAVAPLPSSGGLAVLPRIAQKQDCGNTEAHPPHLTAVAVTSNPNVQSAHDVTVALLSSLRRCSGRSFVAPGVPAMKRAEIDAPPRHLQDHLRQMVKHDALGLVWTVHHTRALTDTLVARHLSAGLAQPSIDPGITLTEHVAKRLQAGAQLGEIIADFPGLVQGYLAQSISTNLETVAQDFLVHVDVHPPTSVAPASASSIKTALRASSIVVNRKPIQGF